MPRELPKTNQPPEDGDGEPQFIQFRGPQSSVTHEATGVHFGTEVLDVVLDGEDRHLRIHEAYPVVDVDAEDPPENAIARPVAERIVETNHLVSWGVACEWTDDLDGGGEACGQVFETVRGMRSHMGSVHREGDGDGPDQSDSDTEGDGGEA